mmetsp:Transcript_73710/g.229941  ORF Transcript_73710/g.229941 Transcript_73710/m.229941 type:complete len:776 (-) Transcript_73710:92-2419(-)
MRQVSRQVGDGGVQLGYILVLQRRYEGSCLGHAPPRGLKPVLRQHVHLNRKANVLPSLHQRDIVVSHHELLEGVHHLKLKLLVLISDTELSQHAPHLRVGQRRLLRLCVWRFRGLLAIQRPGVEGGILREVQHPLGHAQDVRLRQAGHQGCRRLWRALLDVIVDPHYAEALCVPKRPLEVVHEGPREVAADVGALGPGRVHGGQVGPVVADPVWVVVGLAVQVLGHRGGRVVRPGHEHALLLVVLLGLVPLVGAAVLRDDDPAGRLELLLNVEEEVPEAPGDDGPPLVGPLPGVVVDRVRVLVVVEALVRHLEALLLGAGEVEAEPAEVVVDPEEVARTQEQGLLLLRELRKPLLAALHHGGGVVALEERPGKPAQLELHGPPRGGRVLAPLQLLGALEGRVEGDAEQAALPLLEVGPVDAGGLRMGQEQVVGAVVLLHALLEAGVPLVEAGRELPADREAQDAGAARLVERDPVLHAVPEELEARPREVAERPGDLLLGAQPAPEAVLQGHGQVPVVDGDPRRYAVLQQGVDEVRVELRAHRVHRAVPIREEAAPRYGEAVRAQAQLRQDLDVRPPPVVVVARDVPGRAPLGLALGLRKLVPDRGLPAALVGRALDLVGGRGTAPDKARGERHVDDRGRCVQHHNGGLDLFVVQQGHEAMVGATPQHLRLGRYLHAVGRGREELLELPHGRLRLQLQLQRPVIEPLNCNIDEHGSWRPNIARQPPAPSNDPAATWRRRRTLPHLAPNSGIGWSALAHAEVVLRWPRGNTEVAPQ